MSAPTAGGDLHDDETFGSDESHEATLDLLLGPALHGAMLRRDPDLWARESMRRRERARLERSAAEQPPSDQGPPAGPEPEPASENDRIGLPRPSVRPEDWGLVMPVDHEGVPRKVPAPWINGAAAMEGNFYSFRNDHMRAVEERRCCVCGDQLRRLVAIGATRGATSAPETSAGWGHPRCVQMAVALCPHFTTERAQEWGVVAWLYEGPGIGCTSPTFEGFDRVDEPVEGLGRDALAALARANPWGD